MMILLNNAHAAAAAIFRRLPFDPIEDFAPAGVAATMPLILLSARNSEYSDLATLLAAARARPGALNYASVGIGTTQHFVAEALQAASGVTLTHVPYRTTPDALIALRNGDVQLVVETVAAVLGQVRDGEMRPLAITSAARSSALPAVPTVAEAGGLPGFDLATWVAFAFTAGTPVEIIARLNAALVQALADPALRDQVVGLGLTPVGSSPEGARAAIQREIARSREIVARAGIPQQ
jgi:tripartite-type tricarboxylate transporter receptor subunit TctC